MYVYLHLKWQRALVLGGLFANFLNGLALKQSSVGDDEDVGLPICCLGGFTRSKTWVKLYGEERTCMGVERAPSVNTASKLGPHTQTDRGTCPGVGLRVYSKHRFFCASYSSFLAAVLF